MSRPRVIDLATVGAVERELDRALTELRGVAGGQNILAAGSIEFRIARLRRRKAQLEERPRAVSVN